MPDTYFPAKRSSGAVVDLAYLTRDTEVATMTRREASANLAGVASGIVVAGLAVVRKSGPYGTIRAYLPGAGTSLTNLKMGVWTPDGSALLASTADVKATATANGANKWLVATLDTVLALAEGDRVLLGIGCAHSTTSVTVRGLGIQGASSLFSDASAASPFGYRGRNAGVFTTGALPSTLATNEGPGIMPLVELVA